MWRDHVSYRITTWHFIDLSNSPLFSLFLSSYFSWAHMAMHADDQLRQRQAWALSQIIAVGLPGSGRVFYEVRQFNSCICNEEFVHMDSTQPIIYLPLSLSSKSQVNEPYPTFFDQYVRSGFGSYRKLLKSMSFNLIMSEWLTFLRNKSLQYNINNGYYSPPDENYGELI